MILVVILQDNETGSSARRKLSPLVWPLSPPIFEALYVCLTLAAHCSSGSLFMEVTSLWHANASSKLRHLANRRPSGTPSPMTIGMKWIKLLGRVSPPATPQAGWHPPRPSAEPLILSRRMALSHRT